MQLLVALKMTSIALIQADCSVAAGRLHITEN